MPIHVVSKSEKPMNLHNLRRGAVVPLMAIMLPVVLLLAAFAINIAYLELNRTEMFIASDAVSRATGREFMLTNNVFSARARGRYAGSRNFIGNKPLKLANSDFVFGEAERSSLSNRYNFTPGGMKPNSVEVTANRTTGAGR